MGNYQNVYCVGRNYASFAKEMGNKISAKPIIFIKPTHSLQDMDHSVSRFSKENGEVNGEAEIVLHIGRSYEKGLTVMDLVDKVTIGIDYTYRAVLNEVKEKGQPWMPAKAFPFSSGLGRFLDLTSEDMLEEDFYLKLNDEILQVGKIGNMIFSLQTLVDYIGENYGLGRGDLIYTGTPENIAKLKDGDKLEVQWGDQLLGTTRIELT